MRTIIVAEIGINHNGDLDIAKKLIDAAVNAGADYVKFQKRDPSMICEQHRDLKKLRETPQGTMAHLEYRQMLEFDRPEYDAIDDYCKKKGVGWFLSIWDSSSLDFALGYDSDFIKIPSALLTHSDLLKVTADHCTKTGKAFILSTGMSTDAEISEAAKTVRETQPPLADRWLLHCHSAYPAPTEELNLSLIPSYQQRFPTWNIGYSGHEEHGEPSVVAVVLGAGMVERHLTLDKTMWGSDHLASLNPTAFLQLVRRIRSVEKMLGDGRKRVWPTEEAARDKLRPPEYR